MKYPVFSFFKKISIFSIVPVIVTAVLVLYGAAAAGDSAWFPERRRPQFRSEPGYAVVPYAFDLPGIGKGYGVIGAATNIRRTYTDITATGFGGDVDGQALGIDSVHLMPEKLFLDFGGAHLSGATIQSYSQRGMHSDKDDYTVAEFGSSVFGGSRLTATFAERRFEVYAGYYGGSTRLSALRDKDGTVIIETQDAPQGHADTAIYGIRVDMTDDMQDPRRGIRIEPSIWRTPAKASGPDFFTVDLSATMYVPAGKRNTWAFNCFKSDAQVLHKGETDPAVVERNAGLDLSIISDAEERRKTRQYIDSMVAHNSHGTATSLGGYDRLRSYAEGRFSGAHTEFLGTEFRWNLTDEVTPFNIYFMKDIRTAVQVAFFYEVGTVADTQSDLWEISRYSYGAGFRFVTASGIVYRLDFADGREGFQPSIFFQYPWELL